MDFILLRQKSHVYRTRTKVVLFKNQTQIILNNLSFAKDTFNPRTYAQLFFYFYIRVFSLRTR